MRNKANFNFYISTDFATSEKQSADYSFISVWAYNNAGYWFWVDGICRRQHMGANMDDLFRLVQKYKPQLVGIEVTGQQGGFIPWIKSEMMNRNIWFTLASDTKSGEEGIRPSVNKLQRFNVVVPWFKQGMMHFPDDCQSHEALVEILLELRQAAVGGFKSKHDDAIDTISMLAAFKTFKPSEEVMKGSGIWGDDDPVDNQSSLSSYLV